MTGRIVSLNTSAKKGVRKKPVKEVVMKTEYGIEGDGHASSEWHRQVSLLALESIKKMQDKGLDVKPGDFAENITTEGIDLPALPVGTQMILGDGVKAEVTQIGKVCHTKCAIYYQAGDCANCHPDIFNIKKKTTVHFSMSRILKSEFCGVCHLKIAFPLDDCGR